MTETTEPLFDPTGDEVRTSLASTRNLPLRNSTRLKKDQPISGTFTGNVQGFQSVRGFGGTYVETYLIEVVGVMLDDQSA